MLPSNNELVKHILDEISFILGAVKEKDKENVINDPSHRYHTGSIAYH